MGGDFVATDGTDTYVFMSTPGEFSSYDAGIDMVTRLVGVNDLSTLSADNFYTGGYVYADLLG